MRNVTPHSFSFYLKRVCFMIACLLSVTWIMAQNDIWQNDPTVNLAVRKASQATPETFRSMKVDMQKLRQSMSVVPLERNVKVGQSDIIVTLPMPDGSMKQFKTVESSVMQPGLAAKFPQIKSYLAISVDDPSIVTRFSLSPLGFHGMILQRGQTVFIEPISVDNNVQHIAYYQKDLKIPADLKFCAMDGNEITNRSIETNISNLASGNELRTYRLAVSAAGEYSAQYSNNVTNVIAAINAVINQVTLIYEVETSIRFVLINDNDDIVYTDATTDPFTDVLTSPCSSDVREENQTSTDAVIGAANYDIGHVFTGTNIGGCAAGSVICGASKAWGASGVTSGSAFDVGLTSHEMGHQFSAGHTFNSDIGSCSGGQYSASTAYEPASGTTIMSYAGSCHDIQGFRDMYFHTISYEQIKTFSVSGSGNDCPVITNTGNSSPTVNAGPAGFIIPISTPFTLTGSGSDPDGDAITFNWEQFDLGPQGPPNTPTGNAPLFRSFPAVSSPSRTFPQLSDILSNTQTMGEILPSYGRGLTFRLTARDNRLNGGGVEFASTSITVDGNVGPFRVTSPNTSVNWCPGAHTVTWDVNGTDALAESVNILLSTDGGLTFPVTLAASTPNDGSQSVDIPCTYSTTARIKIEAVGNIFFDISNANFTTGDNTKPTFTVPSGKVIEKDANCNYDASTSITGDVTDEADNCDNSLDATYVDATAPGSCVGETILTRTWTLTDDCGNSTVKQQVITIKDVTPPTFTDPADITIYKDENCDHDASVAATGDVTDEADNCDPTLDATYSDVVTPGACVGNLDITRTWTLTDDCGNSISKTQMIYVRDTTRPSITNISTDPSVLWPPDHKMRNVTVSYDAVDNCSEVTSVLSVTSNEPVNGNGDGNTSPDWIVIDDHHVQLRAERAGSGTGRIYTITITSTDDCGNVATATTIVTVPHDQTQSLVSGSEELPNPMQVFAIKASPNPSTGNFVINIVSDVDKSITLSVFDMYGRKVEDKVVQAGSTIVLGEKYAAGTYFLRALQGVERREVKLVKIN